MRLLLALLPTIAFANPDHLDRAAISEGVAKVKAKIVACGDGSSASGTVKVDVKVAPTGNVDRATAKSSPDQALGDCVVAAMKTATFKPTKHGGSFSYPFVFGGKAPPAEAPEPDNLDRAAISGGIAKVKGDIMACATKSNAKGTVKVRVDVRPSGSVAFVKVLATPDAGLAGCVSAAISRAKFKPTAKGGAFTYPFVF